ncbi:MAG: hypothetical protein F6J97_03515 [Leptolyngbya sp. SIO4C1]|nr:hypothetical protein [Leptolyngbya sp. SIO4C1]
MIFFPSSEPMFRSKQAALDIQDLRGLLRLRLRLGSLTLLETHFTRIDQVFLVWAGISAAIFGTAQFWPTLSWTTQAALWGCLTCVGIVTMSNLAWFWVQVERLRWVVYLWSGLMLGGVILTAHGIFSGVPLILMNLCGLWLSLCAAGYGAMGIGMRSRSFLLAALMHLAVLPVLSSALAWQFLLTGAVMSGCLLLLACVQWDMRQPIEHPDLLSEQDRQFNQQQQRLRRA